MIGDTAGNVPAVSPKNLIVSLPLKIFLIKTGIPVEMHQYLMTNAQLHSVGKCRTNKAGRILNCMCLHI